MITSTAASLHETQPTAVDKTLDSNLPEGWESVLLGQIATYRKGKKPERLSDTMREGTVPYIDIEAFERGRVRRYGDPSSSILVNSNDILVVWDGARCGLVGRAPVNGALGSTLLKLDPQGIDPDYLIYFLRSAYHIINSNHRGTGIPHVAPEIFWNLKVPLAPFAEQKRIVAKVEALLARVNAARERLAKVPRILKRFRQAVLAAACSGRLTADCRNIADENGDFPPGWQWRPVGELLSKGGIFDGPFGSNLKTSDYTDSGVRVIRMENVAQLKFIESKEAFISEEKYQSLIKHTVGQGDIIFASFIEDEVRVCVLPALPTKAIAKADCFCLRPNSDVVDRHYLALQLASRDSYDALRESIHGATRPRITTAQLRQLPIRVCPPPEQHEIVRRVEMLFKLADTIEKRVAAATARAEKLTQAILAKAFRGELVLTEAELARREGRSYEPASALLTRVKAERASQGLFGRQRKAAAIRISDAP